MVENRILIGTVTLERFLIFLLYFIVTIIAGNLFYALIRKLLDKKASKKTSKIIARLTQYVVYITGLYYGVYQILGLDITAFFASLGLISVAVAFSSQQIIQNFMAGVLISIRRPIQIEDVIEIGAPPQTGVCRVKDITLMHTLVRNLDGKLFYIPNSVVLSSSIINYTKSGFIRVTMELKIPFASDYEKVKKAILDVVEENPYILPKLPAKEKSVMTSLFNNLFEEKFDASKYTPSVRMAGIIDSSILLSINIWIQDINQRGAVVSELLESLREKFIEEGINLK
ncbi:MAG: mechanosensitive ion channel domain-containing protein [Methanobacteriota archaeon]